MSSRTSRTNPIIARITWTVVLVRVLFFMGVLTVFQLLRKNGTGGRLKESLCNTEDCYWFSANVGGRLNTSHDPCDDFGAFVCSGWKPRSPDAHTTISELKRKWLEKMTLVLQSNNTTSNMMRHAVAMLRSCVNRSGQDSVKSLEVFREFMRERNMAWPTPPPLIVEPLDVLLDLALNWHVPLWFRADLDGGSSPKTRRILFRPDSNTDFWLYRMQLMGKENYRGYWTDHANVFDPEFNDTSDRVGKSFKMQNYILRALANITNSMDSLPGSFRLRNLNNFTKKADLWKRLLRKHLPINPRLTLDDKIDFVSLSLFRIIDNLLANFTREELLEHLSWSFVQRYTFVAYDSALLFVLGDREEASHSLPLACESQAEDIYRLPIIAHFALSSFKASERDAIDNLLRSVIQGALAMVNESTWMNKVTRELTSLLQATTTKLWPEQEFLSEEALNAIFKEFPLDEALYIDYWKKGRKQYANLLGKYGHDESVRLAHPYRDPLIYYDDMRNTITIAMSAVERPLYYSKGTNAMLYGGLGSAYAREMVRALRPVLKDGSTKPGWSLEARDAFVSRATCNGSDYGVFPEVAALEVAFRSFQVAIQKTKELKIVGMKSYTVEQVFFIAFCHLLCRQVNLRKLSVACNSAVRNFEPFARAFKCPVASEMNPSNKCIFF